MKQRRFWIAGIDTSKWIVQKAHVRVWTGGLQQRQVLGCCEHGREALNSIAARDFLDQMSKYQIFRRTLLHTGHECVP
jgi:hypothetical protein